MVDSKISMPGTFGGLMRYDDEYESKIKVSPWQVVGYIIALVVFVSILKIMG